MRDQHDAVARGDTQQRNRADAKTKKPSNKVFTITGKTRVLRAGKPITVKDATVQKGDQVSVVVDHDKPGDEAIEVRLPAAK